MTHSLHRIGDRRFMDEDFVWLAYQAKGINDDDFPRKAREVLEAAEEAGCTNWGDVKAGCVLDLDPAQIKAGLGQTSRIRGVFTSRQQVVSFLRLLREKDVGLSLVVSGLLDEVLAACDEAGVKPHTINFSLGVWGRKELLPSPQVLAITTMCGHHMIASRLVEKTIEDVRRGKAKPATAARRLARMCPCGIFNHERAARLLEAFAAEAEAPQPAAGTGAKGAGAD